MTEGRTSVWQTEARQAPRDAAPPRRVEVLVVGGGISGVSLLRFLQTRGLAVALVERVRLGAGASGRNAGFLLTGVAANYARAVATYGRATAAEIWRFTADNHRLLLATVDAGAIGHHRAGAWNMAETAEEAAALRESAQLLGEDELGGRWVAPAQAPPWAPLGALAVDEDGEVDPLRTVEAIAAPGSGVHDGTEVTGLEPGTGGVRVALGDGGELFAERVIVATNAWTAQLLPGIPIRPVRAQMLCTEPVGRVSDRPVYAGWGYRYFRQLADGRLLVGGCRDRAVDDEVGFGLEPTPRVQDALEQVCAGLGVPAAVQRRWAGTMGFTPDELPLVGEVPGSPGVWVMGGYTGHGMGFALRCAEVLVGSICDGDRLPRWLDVARLPSPFAGRAGAEASVPSVGTGAKRRR